VSEPSIDPSIENEPHLQRRHFEADPSEQAARRNLRAERTDRNTLDERVEHGVWDEPGLSRELSGGAPAWGITYRDWLARRRGETSRSETWAVTIAVAALAGPWAVLGVFLSRVAGVNVYVGGLYAILLAPVIEETMKVAGTLYIVEKKPYFFRSAAQIILCALAGGFAFACIENVLYLVVYIRNPGAGIILWRLTVCTAVHVGCSTVAGLGLVRVWRRIWERRERPDLTLGFPYMVTAVVIHGVYNALAMVFHAATTGF